MSYLMHLKLQPKQALAMKQTQKLMMLPHMQQALHLLQIPVMELLPLIEGEMEQNPLLEYSAYTNDEGDEKDPEEASESSEPASDQEVTFDENVNFEILKLLDNEFRDHLSENGVSSFQSKEEEQRRHFQESAVTSESSLFEHLMLQAKETFSDSYSLQLAEQLIGNFDENGFLAVPLGEIAILNQASEDELEALLEEIQHFEPYGVGARDVQESLLIQLRYLGKAHTLAYKLIATHYENLIHHRIPIIQKKLRCSSQDIEEAVSQISKLDLHPGLCHSRGDVPLAIPDVFLREEEDMLIAEVDDDILPPLRLNTRYLRLLQNESLPMETKNFIKSKIISAKWLVRNIRQRNDTLIRIAQALAEIQKGFFSSSRGTLVPITMKTLAERLELHESTIARAVANKYISTPRGIFPLRSFFTTAYVTERGEDISSKTILDALSDIVRQEDKRKPLSDEALSQALKERGIRCARRTIAKYRRALNIGNGFQRRKY